MNALDNLVHLVIGIWGLSAYRSLFRSMSFARGLAIIYGLLTVMGLIPALNTTLGVDSLFGHAVWVDAATAAIAAYSTCACRGTRAAGVGSEPGVLKSCPRQASSLAGFAAPIEEVGAIGQGEHYEQHTTDVPIDAQSAIRRALFGSGPAKVSIPCATARSKRSEGRWSRCKKSG